MYRPRRASRLPDRAGTRRSPTVSESRPPEETIRQTIDWYFKFYEAAKRTPELVADLTRNQIRAYDEGLRLRL